MIKIEVSSLEFEALKHLESMVRMAMTQPEAAEFVVVAIQALDAVRREESPALLRSPHQPSDMVQDVIRKAMQ